MAKIGFFGPFAEQIMEPVREKLGAGHECVVLADVADITADADVLVTLVFSQEMAALTPNLKLVQVPGAGLDRIDRSALATGTRLANVYGHETGIAEYIIGAMLTMGRSFARLDRKLRSGNWDSQWAVGQAAPPPWPELAGKTLGILGYGHIGRALAHRARAFGMDVLAIRRDTQGLIPPELTFLGGPESLAEVMRRADYLAITLSLSETTRNLVDADLLRLMKPTAYLINVARAEIIDEDALYQCLAEGRIAGAALDVWYRYPQQPGPLLPASRPFHELDNVLMTPHVSGWTEGMLDARSALIAENIKRVVRGEHPIHMIA